MKKKLNLAIIELAAKYDRLANEANFDESKHPRADDGKFTSGGGGSATTPKGRTDGFRDSPRETQKKADSLVARIGELGAKSRADKADVINSQLRRNREDVKSKSKDIKSGGYNAVRAAHRAALMMGLTYNPKTHQYE
jgi:hypothetical protein